MPSWSLTVNSLPMKFESLENAREELKRADHLFYVSLKYTRTVDVIKSVIERLINACSFAIEALAQDMNEHDKLEEIPKFPKLRADAVRRVLDSQEQTEAIQTMISDIDFFLFMRKLNKAEFTRSQEFRRHVTMHTEVDGEKHNVKIDTIKEYFERVKNFVNLVQKHVDPSDDDE